jgi:uncharacterized membrane protein YuzA (DUF378 family)
MSDDELRIQMIMIALVIIGALNWGIVGLTKVNPVENFLGEYAPIVYIIIGVSAAVLFTRRDIYLPFLGQTVIPCMLQTKKQEKTDTKITVKVPPKTKVIYWAALPGMKETNDPYTNYGDYSNSGIAESNEKGEAVLEVNSPSRYTVSWFGIMDKVLEPHIHYRFCKENGMMSRIETVFV